MTGLLARPTKTVTMLYVFLHLAVGRSKNLDGQTEMESHLITKFLLQWLPESGGVISHSAPSVPTLWITTIYIVLVGGTLCSNWVCASLIWIKGWAIAHHFPPCPPGSYTPGTIYIVLVGGTSWSKWVCALLIWLMFFILPSSPPFYQASFTSLLLKDWGSLVEFKINAQSKFTLLEVTINLAACHKNLSRTEVKNHWYQSKALSSMWKM